MVHRILWLRDFFFLTLHAKDHQPQLSRSHRKQDSGARRFQWQQSLHGKAGVWGAIALKPSGLQREKEGARHGEASGQDRGTLHVLAQRVAVESSLPVAGTGSGAARDFSGAGWEGPSPDCGPKAFPGGHGVLGRFGATTMYRARGTAAQGAVGCSIPYAGRQCGCCCHGRQGRGQKLLGWLEEAEGRVWAHLFWCRRQGGSASGELGASELSLSLPCQRSKSTEPEPPPQGQMHWTLLGQGHMAGVRKGRVLDVAAWGRLPCFFHPSGRQRRLAERRGKAMQGDGLAARGAAEAQTSRPGARSPVPSGCVQMGASVGAIAKGPCHLVFCCVI